MKHRVALGLTVVAWMSGCDTAGPGCICAPVTNWEADLTGTNVLPPVTTAATGSVEFRLLDEDPDPPWNLTAGVRFDLAVANLAEVKTATLHLGLVTTNGPAAFTLCTSCDPTVTGTFAVNADLLAKMRSFGTYVEVTTAAGPVLRGQVRNTAP